MPYSGAQCCVFWEVKVLGTNSSVQNASKCNCHQNNKSKPKKVECANYSISWQCGMTMTICTAFNNVRSVGCQHFMTWTHGFMHNIWYNVSRVQRVHWKWVLRNEAGEVSLSPRWTIADEVRFLNDRKFRSGSPQTQDTYLLIFSLLLY